MVRIVGKERQPCPTRSRRRERHRHQRVATLGEPALSSYPGDDALFDELFASEDRHFWFTARNEVIAAVLRRLTRSLPRRYRVLEIGCGTGNVLRVLAKTCGGGHVVAMDLSSRGLRYARGRAPDCAFVQADLHHPPFTTGFDLIGMFDVIEHFADDVDTLRQVRGLLRAGGRLLLTVPAHRQLWSYGDEFAGHYRRYGRQELANSLIRAGFTVEYLTPYMACLFPIMWLQRWVARIHGRATPPRDRFLRDLRPVPIANEMLRWILGKEAIPIGSGLVLPFGTSLLAVATTALVGASSQPRPLAGPMKLWRRGAPTSDHDPRSARS